MITTDSSSQVKEALEEAYQSALREIEMLEFLSQSIGDTGDPLEFTADARAGLSTMLATASSVLGKIAGQIDLAKGMLPYTTPV